MFEVISVALPSAAAAPTTSLPDLIKTVTAVLAIPLAAMTFFLGYRQREQERTRSYYHKVVVDVVLPQILEYFSKQREAMNEAGLQALKGLGSARKTMPRSVSLSLSEFSTGLYTLLDRVTERTLIFDEKITGQIQSTFEDIEDQVTAWFNDAQLHKRKNVEEITQILQRGQRLIIKLLYKGEFRDF